MVSGEDNVANKKKRVSRKEQRLQQVEREKRMRMLRIWLPVGVIVVAFLGLFVARLLEPEVAGARFIDSPPPGQHVTELDIPVGGLPPMGGPHYSAWQNCGIYETVIDPGYAVHSMEHGALWITYHPELPQEQIAALQDRVRGQAYLLLSPYPEQSSPIALTVWDGQLVVEAADDERIDQFIRRYRNARGPEQGASCSGGVGQPLG
jgi:hypothetical protein